MSTHPSVSSAAVAAGLPPRYVYWHGHSGRRYLFTAAGGSGASDFDDGVAIAVQAGAIVWAGDVEALARLRQVPGPTPASIYIHLLCATAEEQAAVIADLRPDTAGVFRLAA